MYCVALWFEDSDQVIEKRATQLISNKPDFMNIDNNSFKFNLKNTEIFSFTMKVFICRRKN